MFQWFYWHALLPGRDIPGITPEMPLAGKDHSGRHGHLTTPDQGADTP